MLHIDQTKDYYLIISEWRDGTNYSEEQDLVSPANDGELFDALEQHDNAVAVLKLNIKNNTCEDVSKAVADRWSESLLAEWRVKSEGYEIAKFIQVNGFGDRLRGVEPIMAPRLVNRYRARRVA